MDEVTKQFYEEVERFAPRNHRGEINWQVFLGNDYDINIPSNYYQARKTEILPPVHIIAALTYFFQKDQLEQFAFHKLKTSKRIQQKAIAEYEKLFNKPYTGRRPRKRRRKEDLQLSLEERELEIKRQRTPLEKRLRRRTLIERVWQMESEGLIGQHDDRETYKRRDEFDYE